MSSALMAPDRPASERRRPVHTTGGTAAGWPIVAALVGLSAIPLTAGTFRLLQLFGGPAVIPADGRFASQPAPLVVHIIGATIYVLLGSMQLVPAFRRRHLTWHRRAGRVLAVAGLMVAGSALWMTIGYAAKPGTGDLLYVLRLIFGSAMVAALLLGFTAARRHDNQAHSAWMIRAYAIGLAAGTQALTGGILLGTGELGADLTKAAGWVINLAVAEWIIRRGGPSHRPRPRRGTTSRTLAAGMPE